MININIEKQLHGSNGEMTLCVNMLVNQGDFIVIMGESGAGKSTLLRCLAGLEKAEGNIVVKDEVWQDSSQNLPIQKRNVGFVFQDFALFDNMNVKENLLFVNRDEVLAEELLKVMEIKGLSKRNVQFLSGGQKQRVALARALMCHPKLLLMDEPLSSLDPRMRHKLSQKIKELHQRFGMTTLMVSHDVNEAKNLANRVWFVESGNVKEYDSTYLKELYE
jgi:molybdate transport system ATP-binding protein